MPGLLLALALLPLAAADGGAAHGDFDRFLAAYRAADAAARGELARSFVERQRERGGFPIVEPGGQVVFLYVGAGGERAVHLLGDFATRSPQDMYWDAEGEPMTRAAPDGGLFFARRQLEEDARIEYQFLVDGERRTDALNPRTAPSGIARIGALETVSAFVMPGYPARPELAPRQGVARGEVRILDAVWADPAVAIYLPASYDAAKRYPVLYTADGSAWRELIGLPAILDNLIADGRIEPLVAVMIDAAEERQRWYTFNPDYLAYLERVVAFVDDHHATDPRPERRLHAGTSAGGRAALYAGFERPHLFGNLALLSPALSGPPSYWQPWFSGARRPEPRLRVWLSAGSYEGTLREDARTMATYFRKAGVETKAVFTHEGHTFGAWRNLVPAMLEHFFPGSP
ncbi:MAG TPA: alpha/beta hydrolase-fold protein [Thermoanaerobaculia bacterium]|nr:alpha/beta hydrolase-fold protein [Thermoanaerobaculia bacterium]